MVKKIDTNYIKDVAEEMANGTMITYDDLPKYDLFLSQVIDFLNDNNVDSVDKYSETEDIKKSNELIKALLKDEIPKDEETNTIEEIIKLNPYNENIYKALLYKYGDEENQIEHLGEFLGYNNIHEYKHKLLDEYYAE